MKPVRSLLGLLAVSLFSTPVLATGVTDALMRAGLDPGALAAAGVTSGEVAGVVADVEEHLASYPTALSTADAAYVAARAEVDRLQRLVKSGQATAQDVSDLASEKSALDSAESAREAALDAIFDAGTADLAAGEKATLAAIRAHRSWALPIEFLVVDRTEQEWLDLREALLDAEAAAEEGVDPDPTCATLLLSESSDPDVAAAKTAHDTYAAGVAGAWTTAVSS